MQRNRNAANLAGMIIASGINAVRHAKIMFGAIVGDARGKVGGNVFSKAGAGSYVRRKVSPTQPRSTAQSNVRSSFTGLSRAWSATLTAAQRSGWIALAKGLPTKDQFGQSITATGLQMYQKLNRALATIGVASIATAPLALSSESPGSVTLVATVTGPVLTVLAATFNTAAMYWVIRCSGPISAGRKGPGSRMQIIKTGVTVLAAAQSFHAEYILKFGEIQAGQQIFVSLQYVNKVNGTLGTPAQNSVIVGA